VSQTKDMSKRKQQQRKAADQPLQQPAEPRKSGAPMVVLLAGGLAVAALVGWAVTRSMDAPTQVAAPPAFSDSTPTDSAATPTNTPVATNPIPLEVTSSTSTGQPAFPPRPAATANTTALAPRVDVAQLKQQLASSAVTVVDVRDSVSYSAGHIPGALSIPFARVEGELAMLPKNKPIVAYCT
jgi:hypothetical protein